VAAIVFGALLLSFTVTAFPLFISATEANLAKAGVTNPSVTPYGAGIEYRSRTSPRDPTFSISTVAGSATRRRRPPWAGDGEHRGPAVSVANGRAPGGEPPLRGMTRTGVRVVDTNHGPGSDLAVDGRHTA
jgi:hypothetical protein